MLVLRDRDEFVRLAAELDDDSPAAKDETSIKWPAGGTM
jgi:hypothetical protein